MSNCSICKTLLDDDTNLLSGNCGGDCVRCMAEAGDPDEIFHVIEILMGEACNIGYAHSSNTGWGPLAEKLFTVLRNAGAVQPRSIDHPAYPKINASNPMYPYVKARQAAGLPVCDSADHNEGCTNPNCLVWGHLKSQ